jgi:hypothetical protein
VFSTDRPGAGIGVRLVGVGPRDRVVLVVVVVVEQDHPGREVGLEGGVPLDARQAGG